LRQFLIELGVGFRLCLKLRCFVIIDLKMGPFKPEYAGKMNFYLSAVLKPLGISEFRHLETLPEQLKGTLPTIEEIEAELGSSEKDEA